MNPRDISIEDFDYLLPGERIAKHPLAVRDACKLLCYDAGSARIDDHIFHELPSLLPAGAMLVYNNTRVINARLRFVKSTGANIEIFCLEPYEPADYATNFASRHSCRWSCLVGNSKKWKEGTLKMSITLASGTKTELEARRTDILMPDNSQVIEFSWDNDIVTFSDIIAAVGEIPIPPYLNRHSESSDSTDYQTVYSEIEGSVAAPTAGLHFTPALLAKLDESGIERREVTLHVGAGTFRPVKADRIGDHEMHSEFIAVERDFISDLAQAVGKRPIIAVGTTTVRTLESLYHIGRLILEGKWNGELPQWAPYTETGDVTTSEALRAVVKWLDERDDDALIGRTRIIIAPGYEYRIVDGMVTNFHQPSSTLLLLVCAFIGTAWREVYDHALASDYRFLSYGDACLFFRSKN